MERKHHLIINPKKVYRLCDKLGILKPQRQVKVEYSRCLARNMRITAQGAVFTLKTALERRNIEPRKTDLIVRSDNGPQFISKVFEEACNSLHIEHERIPAKTPNKNAHIEAFHRLLEDDCLSINEFETFARAYMAVVEYMDYYNNKGVNPVSNST